VGNGVPLARRAFLGGALITLGLRGTFANATSLNERMQGEIAPVHDPCIIKQGDTYYVFSTNTKTDTEGFIACRRSRDLVSWERAGYVFAQIPEWAHDAVPSAKGLWAPDISFFNGEYHLYYSVSSFGSSNSVIGLATSKTLDPSAPGFGWIDKGLVMR
jgi:arabinan endo-1,5-alpha-L-arabinosidase